MNQNRTVAAVGIMVLFIASAAAQTPTVGPRDTAATTIVTVPSGSLQRMGNAWRGRRLIGTPVFNDSGEQIAVISDLLITDDGTVSRVVLSVTLRRRLVTVPFSEFRFVPSRRIGTHAVRRQTRFETAAIGPFGIMLPGASRDTLASMETFHFAPSP
jgi:sporulation protein YlmC with PRC-barrel domain